MKESIHPHEEKIQQELGIIRKKDVVYVAGPMTGKPLWNYPAFFGAAGLIEKEFGCEVLNPARQPHGLDYETYMTLAFQDLRQATVILLLNGWQTSPGARREFAFAAKNRIEILFEEQLTIFLTKRFETLNTKESLKK